MAKVRMQLDITKEDHLTFRSGLMKMTLQLGGDRLYNMRGFIIIVCIAKDKDIWRKFSM